MLTKQQFIKRLNFIINYNKKVEEYDHALKEFAHSDFTGFYDEELHSYLLSTLTEDMNIPPDDDVISWWLYDCPEAGRNPGHCKIWLGDADDPNTEVLNILTPEDLYNYIFITYSKTPSKSTIKSILKAQDSGVKYSLKQIQDIRKENNKTRNQDWEDRDTLLKYTQTIIENHYRYDRGVNADLDFKKDLYIITSLDEES